MTDLIKNLPPISQMMRDCGLEPKKALGQNFLFDLNLTGRIAKSVPDIKNSTVLEIGPGPGGLTRALLMAGANKLIAIEKDETTKPILSKISDASQGRLNVIFDDALFYFDGRKKLDENKVAVCANLPYNVGTELFIRWLHCVADKNSDLKISSITVMFQKEVALRVVAKQGDKQYGRLAVLTSLLADAKILFDVPNTAFFPKPKVQSAIVQVIPNPDKIKKITDLKNIENITAKLFGQRRKMIRGIIRDVDWEQFGLTGTMRGEEISPEKYLEISKSI